MAFQHFPDETKGIYMAKKDALGRHSEPPSRQNQYQAEFHMCRQKKTEGWADDSAEELRVLVDEAYTIIEDKGREQLALNCYLGEPEHLQVAFSIKGCSLSYTGACVL